jgi:quercetin dioxygenase-like cupin family protein
MFLTSIKKGKFIYAHEIPDHFQMCTKRLLTPELAGTKNLRVSYVIYLPGGGVSPHKHPYEQAFYCISGEITAKTPNGEHKLKNGSIIYFSANEEHGLVNTGHETAILLMIATIS